MEGENVEGWFPVDSVLTCFGPVKMLVGRLAKLLDGMWVWLGNADWMACD